MQGHSPLQPAQPSPDSVAMEIIWARFPANDPVLNDAAWRDIDETQIEPAVRARAGQQRLPRRRDRRRAAAGASRRVLHQGESPPDDASRRPHKAKTADLIAEPIVHGRMLPAAPQSRAEIQASEVYPTLPLLVSGGGELGGHTYAQAQAIYALRVDPQPDRTALVELTPELHHGAAAAALDRRRRWHSPPGAAARPRGVRPPADVRAAGPGRNARADEPAGRRQPAGPLFPHGRLGRRPAAKADSHPPGRSAAERHVCRSMPVNV